MRRLNLRAGVFLFAFLLLAGSVFSSCSDGAGSVSPPPPVDSTLEGQIRSMFPLTERLQDSALAQLGVIRQQVAQSALVNARATTLSLVDFTLKALRNGKLNPGNSGSAATSVSKLTDGLYQLAAMDPPKLSDGALTNDGVIQVVGPQGGTLVTPTGAAGVDVPSGTFEQPVLVAVTRIATPSNPNTGPLPTTVKQYPPYYEYSTYPAVAQFGDSARVGICQVTDPASPFYPPEPHDRLRLAHAVGSSVQILERVGVNDFLRCAGTSAVRSAGIGETGWRSMLATLGAELRRVGQPTELYAAHGGLGGKVKSFSPFGAVDPTLFVVPPNGTYLLTSSNDTPSTPGLIVDLVAQGITPGDRLRLQQQGDFSYGVGRGDSANAMLGVFSATNTLLAPSNRNRVPGAIGTSFGVVTSPTLFGAIETDIPEDFPIGDLTITVPAGAKYLFVGARDVFYRDNTDPDGDFSVRITKLQPP